MRQLHNFVLVLALVGCSKGGPATAASPVEESELGPSRPGSGAPGQPGQEAQPTVAGDDFQLARAVASGGRVYVRNLNGPIRAEGHAGDEVEIEAVVKHRGDRPAAEIRFAVVEHDGGFTVCALWPADDSECGERGSFGHDDVHRNGTSVDFVVRVPSGVQLDVATVNGSTRVAKLEAGVWAATVNGAVGVDTNDGPVEARSVNGDVSVRTGEGAVRAETVNGGIDVAIGKLSSPVAMELSTVNGSIEADLPDGFGAELEASVLNGTIAADLPLSRVDSSRRHLRAIVGAGGPRFEIATTNGSIRLR